MTLRTLTSRFLRNRSGATSIEYGLIAALITLGLLGAMNVWGQEASGMYEDLASQGWSEEGGEGEED